jgi:hypothetical protein
VLNRRNQDWKHHLNLSCNQIGESRPFAAIRYVKHIHAGGGFELLSIDM